MEISIKLFEVVAYLGWQAVTVTLRCSILPFRLNEDTFTIDEVKEMLDGLLSVVRGEVESELINTAHTNVLLLRQVFIQAEKWHLKLQADISELENRFVRLTWWVQMLHIIKCSHRNLINFDYCYEMKDLIRLCNI